MQKIQSYKPLLISAGLGSILGSGIIVGLSSTITVWQTGLGLSDGQVGIVSGALTFAIAIGSLLAGKLTKSLGLLNAYNNLDLGFLAGVVLCMLAQNYWMLLIGAVLAGFFSGADLPISLTMISHDAPDKKTSAELVSASQIYWTIGIIGAVLIAFVTSTLSGTLSPRIEMGALVLVAAITVWMRKTNKNLRAIHEAAPKQNTEQTKKVSMKEILFGSDKKYLSFLICILVFYCGWNLLANTFGQFQTFMLVKANASQSFATGSGIILNVVCLIVATLFSKIAGGKKRNVAFVAGIMIMVVSLCGLAMSASNLWLIVAWIAFQNVGSTFAGEAMYKVWTQESFPVEVRSDLQGFINGFSRLLCAAFATITPILVLPEHIRTTMFGFAALILVAGLFGMMQMKLQKKHGVGSLEKGE